MLDERDGRSRDEKHSDAPAARSSAPHPSAARGSHPEVGSAVGERGSAGGPTTVMIVDDDDAIREALEDVLTDEGYRIVGMSDGQQALDYLNADGSPAAILLDLWMPVMDGWKFLDALLDDSRFSRIPLIVLTAARDQRARELRVSEVLTKPVQLQQVLSALERLTKVS